MTMPNFNIFEKKNNFLLKKGKKLAFSITRGNERLFLYFFYKFTARVGKKIKSLQ